MTRTVAALDVPVGVEVGALLRAGSPHALGLAGEGAGAIVRPDGRVEVRALRDGTLRASEDRVEVVPLVEIDGTVDATVGDRALSGSLRIDGHVAPGRTLRATGSVRVEGMVDRSELRAGGELRIENRATRAHLVGGAATGVRVRVHATLREAATDIDGLLLLAEQLLAVRPRPANVTPARVVRVLAVQRFDHLVARLDAAGAILVAARRREPWVCAELAGQVALAQTVLRDPEKVEDPLRALSAVAGFLSVAIPARRPDVAGVRVAAAHGCVIEAAGHLRITGAGAIDCDLTAGGDLVARGSGGVIRGGQVRVGGRVIARELTGREGAPLRIVLEGADLGDDALRADVVGPGVEVVVEGRSLTFDRPHHDVRIGISAGRPVLVGA